MSGQQLTLDQALQKLTPAEVNQALPTSLLAALERRWFEDFDINQYPLVSHKKQNLRSESRFLQVYEVAHSEDRQLSLHLFNMQNVISSLRDGSHSLAYTVCSNGQSVKLMLGVRNLSAGTSRFATRDYIEVLYRALRSNFPGIVLSQKPGETYRNVPIEDYQVDLIDHLSSDPNLAAIIGIPSLRDSQRSYEVFTQSIDRLVDALRGEAYTLLVLAEPISDAVLAQVIARARDLGEQAHNLVRQSISLSETRGQQITEGESKGQNINLGAGQFLSTIFGITFGQNWSTSTSVSTSESLGASITRETLNKTAQFCEQVLDQFVQRIQTGRSLGFWNVGVFLSSANFNTLLRARGIACSLFAGQNSYLEPIRVLDLSNSPREVRQSLEQLRVPALEYLVNTNLRSGAGKLEHPLGNIYHSLGTPLTTDELSVLVSLPNREVPGLKLKPVADFNLNPPPSQGAEIGTLLYRGEPLPTRIAVSPESLNRHTFVTGLTGSGKTNTCLALLADAHHKKGLNFLVIDPAKTEYRFLLNSGSLGKELMIFTLGEEDISPFRLNPFEFVRGFPLLSHIDLIKAVFNAAFPMYASMPYLLEEAILEIYQERGWDIAASSNHFLGDIRKSDVDYTPYLPRLSDLYAKIDVVVARKRYDARIAQDLTAALKARLGSLLNGGKGLMLDTSRSIPIRELLGRPVVLELRRAGDDDERAFLMALIFILLYEACQTRAMSNELQHITLIEEAHRLLRNIPVIAAAESANPRGKTVEMFTDMMAEMRSYGEGFIIVDQMPGKLVPDVIKGSNLKIVHRLMAQDDRQAVGNAMGMTAAQIEYLPRLTKGQAIIHSEELEEPCLAKIDSVEDELGMRFSGETPAERADSAVQELRQRSERFYSADPKLLYKYAGCALCDAPCTYHPESNRPNEAVRGLALNYLNMVVLGTPVAQQRVQKQLQAELHGLLRSRFGDIWQEGQERCLHVLLAAYTARRFAQVYSQESVWKAVIQLERRLAAAWESWPASPNELQVLRRIALKEIARNPARPRPGCAECPRRCWFGALYQIPNHPLVAQVAGRIKDLKPGEKISPDKLVALVQKNTVDLLEPSFLPYAAYCLLAQATDDEAILSVFLNKMAGELPPSVVA